MLFFIDIGLQALNRLAIRKFGIYRKNGTPLLRIQYSENESLNAAGAVAKNIFLGQKVVTKEVSYMATSALPTKPVENGSFKNDSRINNPDVINLQIQIKAFEYELGNYIAILEKAKNGIEIFDIITPQRTAFDVALKSYDYINNQNRNTLTFNLEFQQIRITKLIYNSVQNPKNKNNANTKNRSNAQPTKVSEEKKKSLFIKGANKVGIK